MQRTTIDSTTDYISLLPNEILFQEIIKKYLSFRQIVPLALVSLLFNNEIKKMSFWESGLRVLGCNPSLLRILIRSNKIRDYKGLFRFYNTTFNFFPTTKLDNCTTVGDLLMCIFIRYLDYNITLDRKRGTRFKDELYATYNEQAAIENLSTSWRQLISGEVSSMPYIKVIALNDAMIANLLIDLVSIDPSKVEKVLNDAIICGL